MQRAAAEDRAGTIWSRETITNRQHKLVPEKGLTTLKDARRRFGVQTAPIHFEGAYNAAQSEQVPTGDVAGIPEQAGPPSD